VRPIPRELAFSVVSDACVADWADGWETRTRGAEVLFFADEAARDAQPAPTGDLCVVGPFWTSENDVDALICASDDGAWVPVGRTRVRAIRSAPPASSPSVNVHLDGKQIAESVNRHLGAMWDGSKWIDPKADDEGAS